MKTTKQLGCQIGILDGSDKLTIKKPNKQAGNSIVVDVLMAIFKNMM